MTLVSRKTLTASGFARLRRARQCRRGAFVARHRGPCHQPPAHADQPRSGGHPLERIPSSSDGDLDLRSCGQTDAITNPCRDDHAACLINGSPHAIILPSTPGRAIRLRPAGVQSQWTTARSSNRDRTPHLSACCEWSPKYPGCRSRRDELPERTAFDGRTKCRAARRQRHYSRSAPGSSAWTRDRTPSGAWPSTSPAAYETGLSEKKNISSPSSLIDGCCSSPGLLSSTTRLAGPNVPFGKSSLT